MHPSYTHFRRVSECVFGVAFRADSRAPKKLCKLYKVCKLDRVHRGSMRVACTHHTCILQRFQKAIWGSIFGWILVSQKNYANSTTSTNSTRCIWGARGCGGVARG